MSSALVEVEVRQLKMRSNRDLTTTKLTAASHHGYVNCLFYVQ